MKRWFKKETDVLVMSLTAGSLANVFCLDPVIEEETEYIPAPMHCCRECKGASGCTASLCPYPTPSLLTDNWWWDGVSITDTPRPAQGLINYFHLVIFLLVCFLLFLFLVCILIFIPSVLLLIRLSRSPSLLTEVSGGRGIRGLCS